MGVGESRTKGESLRPSPFAKLDELRLCLAGQVMLPGERAFELARRRPFNHDARGVPAVIVRVESVEDVVAAMRFYFAFGRPVGSVCPYPS